MPDHAGRYRSVGPNLLEGEPAQFRQPKVGLRHASKHYRRAIRWLTLAICGGHDAPLREPIFLEIWGPILVQGDNRVDIGAAKQPVARNTPARSNIYRLRARPGKREQAMIGVVFCRSVSGIGLAGILPASFQAPCFPSLEPTGLKLTGA
jgi:hypothetical protein